MSDRSREIRVALDYYKNDREHEQFRILFDAAEEYADLLDTATEPDYEVALLPFLKEHRRYHNIYDGDHPEYPLELIRVAVDAAIDGRLIDRRET